MTVVDVNTGKFTGSGGNLEETVTKNNLESAEEIVRQLRLRDIGGIVVIDFIDMVLESNRDLVLRRLVECLGRDRTRHQVAEVTSLGLVQMTRKRIGTGLLEAFSEDCEHCKGRGLTVHDHPIEPSNRPDDGERRGGRRGRGNGDGNGGNGGNGGGRSRGGQSSAPTPATHAPSPADIAAMPRHEPEEASSVPDEGESDLSEAPVAAGPVDDVTTEPVEVMSEAALETPAPEAITSAEPAESARPPWSRRHPWHSRSSLRSTPDPVWSRPAVAARPAGPPGRRRTPRSPRSPRSARLRNRATVRHPATCRRTHPSTSPATRATTKASCCTCRSSVGVPASAEPGSAAGTRCARAPAPGRRTRLMTLTTAAGRAQSAAIASSVGMTAARARRCSPSSRSIRVVRAASRSLLPAPTRS